MNTVHNVNLGSSFRGFLLKNTDFLSDYTVAICGAAKRMLVEKNIVSSDKIRVIYNGIDPVDFLTSQRKKVKEEICREFSLKAGTKIAVSIGRLRSVKGYSYLLEALRSIRDGLGGWHFFIIGDGELRLQLEEESNTLGLNDYLTFTGVRDDIPRLLSGSEFLVLASLWEGLPVVIEEAMAAGLPVVATEVGGVPELVLDRKTGFIINPGDSRELAKVLQEVISLSGNKIGEMGEKGRERVTEIFTSQKMAEEYAGVYSTLLESSKFKKSCAGKGNDLK